MFTVSQNSIFFYLDVAQGRMNGALSETRIDSGRFACQPC